MKTWKIILLTLLIPLQTFTKPPKMPANRQPSTPFITGDGFRSMANHVFDETDWTLQGSEIKDGDIIFVKSDKMGNFFNQVHPHINARYILITHNSAGPCPGEYAHFLEDPKIIKWFGQNQSIPGHPKFVSIPLGIANRYISPHGNRDNFMKFYGHSAQKKWSVAINFNPGTYRQERDLVYKKFIKEPYCKELYSRDHVTYLSNMSTADFVLSPRGYGLDCHRTWEAIIVGSIPIVKTSYLDELLSDLPVLIVNDWKDINPEFLEQALEKIKINASNYNIEKLELNYWFKIISTLQNESRSQS